MLFERGANLSLPNERPLSTELPYTVCVLVCIYVWVMAACSSLTAGRCDVMTFRWFSLLGYSLSQSAADLSCVCVCVRECVCVCVFMSVCMCVCVCWYAVYSV